MLYSKNENTYKTKIFTKNNLVLENLAFLCYNITTFGLLDHMILKMSFGGNMFNSSTIKPEISAYVCMKLIFSKLVQKGKIVLRLDKLVPKLYEFHNAEDPYFSKLFEDVAFKQSYDTITSIDVEDSLCDLQAFGAIGKLNPAYEKLVIYITPSEAEAFLTKYKEYEGALEKISEVF